MVSSACGELVRLELPQMERPLSSREDTEPEPVLFIRRLFIGWGSSEEGPVLLRWSWSEEPASEMARVDKGSLEGEPLWLLGFDWMCFRLQRDWPVSRNPLAKGLLSIFSFVIWSFCKWRRGKNRGKSGISNRHCWASSVEEGFTPVLQIRLP